MLIDLFASGIQPALMTRILSMDTIPTTLAEWYTKAAHFKSQWDRAKSLKSRHQFSSFNFRTSQPKRESKPPRDENAMDVDLTDTASKGLSKLTNEEREYCRKNGLCFRCRKKGHNSRDCKGTETVRKFERKVTKIEEVESDNEEPQVPKFSLDF